MSNHRIHYPINSERFREALADRGISIRSLGNPDSIFSIGVSDKTIFRGLKNGWFSEKTLDKLSDILDVDDFLVKPDYETEIEILKQENEKLRSIIFKIKDLIGEV